MALADTSDNRCPRCAAAFGCGLETGSCWCAEVALTPQRQAQLAARYDGCLCPGCLRELDDRTSPAAAPLL